NPSGRVFDHDELEGIAELCIEHDLIAICDEVYEHLFYDEHVHRPLALMDGMQDRTLTISSTGKTFSMTGWKIGWAHGPAALVNALFAAHQFLTFSTAAPLQHAMALALRDFGPPWLEGLRRDYDERRHCLLTGLKRAGFEVAVPEGSYFVLARHAGLFEDGDDDVQVARRLVIERGVTAIPPSSFYREGVDEGRRLLRFAFCKRRQTIAAAMERLVGVH
ncbi:MAG TPA: aminotransferase class I/II-fold pyridoxal phosphate-dependent enzyme, partial [Planctomycetota bacterium]|nr:aminotransferase class I/II-fold pyridoxal phosphate-dependent enzyme [Planctomycetota bacterium]